MEQRYPPYDWMNLKGYALPKAYDAKTFLICAKQNRLSNRDFRNNDARQVSVWWGSKQQYEGDHVV